MASPRSSPALPGLPAELYQLVQAAVYHGDGLWGEACFDLYLRELPADHGYAIAAGIEPAIEELLSMSFSEEQVAWLAAQPLFENVSEHFFSSLRHFRFSGDIRAVQEGTPVFPGEPLLQVCAPLTQVGLVETVLLQRIHHATSVATRAGRLVQAAEGRPLVDFGARTLPDQSAAIQSARAAWIAGFASTTCTAAGWACGVPTFGVASDDLVGAYDSLAEATAALKVHFPEGCAVDLPELDPLAAIPHLRHLGSALQIVRLSHRDLGRMAPQVRKALDRHGLRATRILGSGRLDEATIGELVARRVPVDLFGVATSLRDGTRTPRLSYRMAEITRGLEPTPATGPGSAPWPGRKQILRMPEQDLLSLEIEHARAAWPEGKELLRTMVAGGESMRPPTPVAELREHCQTAVAALPAPVRGLKEPTPFRVQPSGALAELALK